MRRHHLIEVHEQSWCPASWRSIYQMALGKSLTDAGLLRCFIAPCLRLLARSRPRAVLDMCSGSGDVTVGVWKSLASSLDTGKRPTLLLSDLYPNIAAYRRWKQQHPGLIDYCPEPVDAKQAPAQAPRVRTLFNCFHHFRPEEARAILSDAADNSDGIAIFEITGRTWQNLAVAVLVTPLKAAFVTAFGIRPFRLRNVILGILLPVIPLIMVFDCVVSNLRTYTVEELREMTRSIGRSDFQWEVGQLDVALPGLKATYLAGWRTELSGAR